MTAAKQIQAIKWIASTFGISIIGLIIWGATITSQVKQNTKEMKNFWILYNLELKQKELMVAEFAKVQQQIIDMEKADAKEVENNMIKKLFEHQKDH